MLWLLIAITLLGFILLALGLRGRVVGDEPRCRKCRFDLSGLEIESAESVCPECAAILSSPKAIRSGQRLKRRRALVLGVVLMLLPLGLMVPILTGHWTSWNKSKPILVLSLDTDFGSDHIRAEALLELRQREIRSGLDTKGKRALLHARAAQFERATSLDLSDLAAIQRAHESDELSDQRWNDALVGIDRVVQTYLDGYGVPERWGLVRGANQSLEGRSLFPEPVRSIGPTGGLGVLLLIELTDMKIDGVAVDPEDPAVLPINNVKWYQNHTHVVLSKGGRGSSNARFEGRPEPSFDSPRNPLRSLGPGDYELITTWTIEPFVGSKISSSGAGNDVLESSQALTPRTLTASTQLRIVESSPSLIVPITDADRLRGAQSYFTLNRVQEQGWYRQSNRATNDSAFTVYTSWQGSSGEEIAMIGHLEFEWGGQRVRPSASFGAPELAPSVKMDATRDQGQGGGFGRTLVVTPLESRPPTVTVIFVPDLLAAPDYAGPWLIDHADPMPTVAEEIRWEDVPVVYLEPEKD